MRLTYVAKVDEILKGFYMSITMTCCCDPKNILKKSIGQVSSGRQGVDWESWSINNRVATLNLTDVIVVNTIEEPSSLLVNYLIKKSFA